MALPGDFFKGVSSDEPDAVCCVEGCAAPVYGRRAGEVDSFGVEWDHFCEEHYFEALNKPDEPIIGDCEWCKATDVEVKPTRDIDEGFNGPVYDVCKGCCQAQIKRLMEDMEQYSEMEDDSELYENLDDLRAELSEEDEEEDPEVVAINDLGYELSQSTLLTREDIRALLKGAATETIRQIADNCTEGQYSRLFPRVI